jgi:hypothetical protein
LLRKLLAMSNLLPHHQMTQNHLHVRFNSVWEQRFH